MPNWKKVITSGSDAILNDITASGGILTSQNIMPDVDNTLSLGSSTQRFQLNGGTPVTVDGNGSSNTITRFQSATTVENSTITNTDSLTTIVHDNDGNDIFIVSGSNGELIKVTDTIGETLFQVNDGSGISHFEVSSSGTLVAQNLEYTNETFVLTYNSQSGNINFFSASAIVGTPTLQEVTDEGSTTTNSITTTNSVFASTLTGSLLRLDENGTGMRMTNVGAFENSSGFHIFSNNALRFSTNGASNEALNIDTSQNVTLTGKLIVPEKIEHSGDTNTYLQFAGSDDFRIVAGGIDVLKATASEIAFNDGQANYDFRVEGDTEANLIFVDASTDRVGIGTNTPNKELQVVGDIDADDVTIDGWGSVSSSLSTLTTDVANIDSSVTLQDATTNGNTTTNSISVGGITVTSMGTGTDNSVVVKNSSNQLVTDEIDSRVWGSSLVDGTNGANNRIATFTDSNSLNGESKLLFDSSKFRVISSNTPNAGIEIYGGIAGSVNPYITPSGSHTVLQFGSSETGLSFDVRRNKIAFDSDVTNTYIQADSSSPENLEIHADQNIELRADGKTEVYSTLELNTVVNAGADTDKFLVLDSNNNVDFRTGTEVYDDIGITTLSSSIASDIASLQTSVDSVVTPIQLVVDCKTLTDGAVAWYAITDLQPNADRAFTTWIAPAAGYLDEVVVSPEQTNTTTDDVAISFIKNAGNQGTVTVTMGAAGTNKTFSFGSSTYSFSKGDRLGLLFGKNTNTSDLYNVMVSYRLDN